MAILTVTIQEELVLNGRNFDVSNISTFSATEVIHRMVDLTTAEKSIVLFASENEAGTNRWRYIWNEETTAWDLTDELE